MGFNLPGKSIQVGTSGHRSALKMRETEVLASALKMKEQEMASALKMKASPAKSPEYDAAAKKDPNLGSYVAERKKIKAKYGGDRKKYRASDEYKANQSKINKAYGIDDGYKAVESGGTLAEETTQKKVEDTKTEESTPKATVKAEEKIEKLTTKATKKKGEIDEDFDVSTARAERKEARKLYGRGSKEHLKAKLKVKEEKAADIKGEKGGRKRGLFRGLAKKRNLARQRRLKKRIEKKGGGTTVAEEKTKSTSGVSTDGTVTKSESTSGNITQSIDNSKKEDKDGNSNVLNSNIANSGAKYMDKATTEKYKAHRKSAKGKIKVNKE